MRGLYLATITYQQLAVLHNALTLLWLGLPAAILVLAYLRFWPGAVACLLLDVAVAWARARTLQAARQGRPARAHRRQVRKF